VNTWDEAIDYEHKKIGFYFKVATGLHLLVIVGAILFSKLEWFSFDNDLLTKKLSIVESSIRVDVVAMPKMTIQELKNVDNTPVESLSTHSEEKTVRPSEGETVFKKEKKKLSFSEMMKKLAKEKVAKSAVGNKQKKTNNKKINLELQKLVIAGNKLGKGSSFVAEKSNELGSKFESYVASLPDQIRPNWKLPSYLLGKGLSCHLRLFISKDGKVLKVEVFKSSGDSEYDDWAKQSVLKSSPFRALEEDISYRGLKGDIILGFPLE